jgi:hypothetical protein
MPTESRTLVSSKSAALRSPNDGAGAIDQLPIGAFGGVVYRGLVQMPSLDWTGLGVRRVVSAKLKLKNDAPVIVSRGAQPRIYARQISGAWNEGSMTSFGAGAAVAYPGPGATGSSLDSGELSTVDGAWVEVDVTTIVRAWAPTTVENGLGQANYGFQLRSFDEGTTSRTTEFWSDDTSFAPQLVITYETNTAPNAPTLTNLAAAENGDPVIAEVSRSTGVPRVTFTGAHSDPDVGDYASAVQVQVFADGATDAVPGTPLVDSTTNFTGTVTAFGVSVDVSALTIGTTYRSRVKTRDRWGAWGAWSSLTTQRWKPNTVPGVPTNRAVDPTSLTPDFFGTLSDPDPGAAISEVRIVVYQDTTSGAVLLWDAWTASGGQRFQIDYSGLSLNFGTTYRWAAQVRDNVGSVGPLSSFDSWQPLDVTGPTNMTPRTIETKQNTLTPTLTVGHGSPFDSYELQVSRTSGGPADMWTKTATHTSTTSIGVVYGTGGGANTLEWGRQFFWRARVRVGGVTWSEWSPWYPFYINALPYAPVVSVTSGSPTLSPAGVWTTTTSQPVLSFPFTDPDLERGYADVPIDKQVEIRRADNNAIHGSYSPATLGGSGSTTTVTPALTAGVTYNVRVRWRDSAGQYGSWSALTPVLFQTAFTVTQSGTPSSSDPTPVIAWTVNRTQAYRRVILQDTTAGEDIYDTGKVATSSTSFEAPGELLTSGHNHRAFVEVWDTQGFRAEFYSSIWSTSFATPGETTGLSIAEDTATPGLVLTWTTSPLGAGLFWRYFIYRKDPDGNYRRIGEVTDQNTPTYTDLEAPHGITVDYGVTTSNGWAEGAMGVASGVLLRNWWLVHPTDPDLRFELRYVPSGGLTERYNLEQRSFTPLGRSTPVVVSSKLMPPAGTLQLNIIPTDVETFDLLKRAAKVDPYVVIKSPFGDVYRVRLGQIERSIAPGGMRPVSIAYTSVE